MPSSLYASLTTTSRSIPYHSPALAPRSCATIGDRCRSRYCSLQLTDHSQAALRTKLTPLLRYRRRRQFGKPKRQRATIGVRLLEASTIHVVLPGLPRRHGNVHRQLLGLWKPKESPTSPAGSHCHLLYRSPRWNRYDLRWSLARLSLSLRLSLSSVLRRMCGVPLSREVTCPTLMRGAPSVARTRNRILSGAESSLSFKTAPSFVL